MSARIVDKEEKRRLILDAALQVFARRGFAQATIQEIATEAGIGKGTLYEYFRSKEEIVTNTWQSFMAQMDIQLTTIINQPNSAPEMLRRVLAVFLEVLKDDDGIIRVIFSFWAEAMRDTSQSNTMFSEMNSYYRAYRNTMSEVLIQGIREGHFRSDLDPGTTSSALIGMLDGLLAQWILDPEALDVTSMTRNIPDLILRGIQVTHQSSSSGGPISNHRRQA